MHSVPADYFSHVRRDIFPLVPRGGVLLDLGGGDGATAAALKREGVVDRAGVADRVRPASSHVLDFHYCGDLEDPAMLRGVSREEGPFDTILCLDILEHLSDPWSFVERLTPLLTPGGVVVASIPNVRHYAVSFPLFFRGRWTYRNAGVLDRTHLRFFVRKSAIELMVSGGLTLDAVIALAPGRRRDRFLAKATLGLAQNFLTRQYAIRVRRSG